jgi:hypothetical protein
MKLVKTFVKTPFKVNYSAPYKYRLAVSSDSLYVISSSGNGNSLEVIIKGSDRNAYLYSLENGYGLQDAISAIKTDIILGRNPLDWILKSL